VGGERKARHGAQASRANPGRRAWRAGGWSVACADRGRGHPQHRRRRQQKSRHHVQ